MTAEPLSEEKLGSKKVCGVCGRERLNGLCRAKDSDRYCDTASADGYDTARCWRLGYERLAAILTPEVLRLIEAGEKYRDAYHDPDKTAQLECAHLLQAALALPFREASRVQPHGKTAASQERGRVAVKRILVDHEKGYRKAVATAARVLNSTEWDRTTRRRLRGFIRLMASFARGREALDAAEVGPRAAPPSPSEKQPSDKGNG